MRVPYTSRSMVVCLGGILCGWSLASAAEDSLEPGIEAQSELNKKGQAVQDRIDKLDKEAEELVQKYRSALRELEGVKNYNEQLQKEVDAQENQIDDVQSQIEKVEVTKQEIVPFMLKMESKLEQFVKVDMPFRRAEREAKVANLRDLMSDPDASVGKRFRRIMKAYREEIEYGSTIGTYRGELDVSGDKRTVDFLRVGRVGLLYQTIDQRNQGYWDQQADEWKALPGRYQEAISQGVRIAKEQAAPNLFKLPVPAAEEAK